MAGNSGNQFGDLIGDLQVEARRARRVAHRRAGRERSKSDDLRDFIFAVFVRNVLHHFVAALVGKVHVNVGRGDAIRIQKTLEQQAIRQRIEVGDAQHIRHQTARRAAATADQNAALFAPVDEILHHQKITG